MVTREEFIQIINELKAHQGDPNWLADALITLSTFLIFSSEEIVQAQFEEESAILRFMDAQLADGKKMSKTEAESRALVETKSHYKQLLLEREGIVETINACKKKLDFLSNERKMG